MKNNDTQSNNNKVNELDEKKDKLKEQPVNIERYHDPEGLTVKKLNFGLWFAEHRHQLLKIVIGFLIIISVLSWSYFFYGFGYYLIYGMKEDEILAKQLVDTKIIGHQYFLDRAAKDIIYFTPQILQSSPDKYDFLVQIRNPNTKHWGEFKYYFQATGEELTSGESFILPSETKYIVSLAHELSTRPTNALFNIAELEWHRISPHQIKNIEEFKEQHLDFIIEDILFTPATETMLSDRVKLNNLDFKIINNTAFSYWQVDFIILLYQRGIITGVNQYTIDELQSQTTRNIKLSWPGQFGRIDNVEIMPAVNIMDIYNYIEPEGGVGVEK